MPAIPPARFSRSGMIMNFRSMNKTARSSVPRKTSERKKRVGPRSRKRERNSAPVNEFHGWIYRRDADAAAPALPAEHQKAKDGNIVIELDGGQTLRAVGCRECNRFPPRQAVNHHIEERSHTKPQEGNKDGEEAEVSNIHIGFVFVPPQFSREETAGGELKKDETAFSGLVFCIVSHQLSIRGRP